MKKAAEKAVVSGECVRVRVLILPHFEVGEMTGDFPGEAQLFYERYCAGGAELVTSAGVKVYLGKGNGVALAVTGSGKVNATLTLASILTDPRMDCADAYIFSVGCAGGAVGVSTMGDVVIASGLADFDLGHTADIRDMREDARDPLRDTTWFEDPSYREVSGKVLCRDLVARAFALTREIPLRTTETARRAMRKNFGDAEWANRPPRVLIGSAVTGDNFWKGLHGHNKANRIVETYALPDPYAVSEMEDIAVGCTAERFGLLDRLIVLRAVVNADVFLSGDSPESLWGKGACYNDAVKEENTETLDVFEPAMHNLFDVGERLISAILNGRFGK